MDFHRRQPSSTGIDRHHQRRLLYLLLGLGLVFVLMREARRPERWQWLANLDQVEQPAQLPAASDASPAGDQVPSDLGERSTAIDGEAASVDEHELSAIRDNTPFQQSERSTWYALFRRLREHDSAWLRQQAQPVTFVQLDRQPAAYRGQVVTLTGTVRLVITRDDPVVSSGIERYYQVWLQPRDQPDSLIVAYALELPTGFPIGDNLDEPANITGYFFKRWAYSAQDGVRTVPLLLAQSVDWRPYRTVARGERVNSRTLAASIGLVIIAALFTVWTVTRRGNQPSKFDQYVRSTTPEQRLVPPEMEPVDDEAGHTLNIDIPEQES